MSTGHPDGLAALFLDRYQVPATLRAEGLRLHTLAEIYGTPADERWPTLNGSSWQVAAAGQYS